MLIDPENMVTGAVQNQLNIYSTPTKGWDFHINPRNLTKSKTLIHENNLNW